MVNSQNIFRTLKSAILTITVFLFPLFFLPITQEYFATNKLYLLSIAALLLLLNSSAEIILTKKIFFYKRASNILTIIFVLSVFLSILLASPNRIQAVLNPNFGLLPILMLSIISFYIRDSGVMVTRILSLSSFILSTIAIFFFFRTSPYFSPIGNQLDLVTFLGFCLVIQLTGVITDSSRPLQLGNLLNKIIFTITLTGFIISLNSLLSTGLPDFSSFRYSWYSAVELLKNPLNALYGIGVDNYSSLFSKVKDAAYNQSKFWQISSFNLAQSAFLHIMTESGLLGLILFLLLFIFLSIEWIKRHKLAILIIIYLTAVFLLLPPSLPLFFIFFIGLSCTPSGCAETQTHPEGVISIDLKQKPFLYAIPLLMIGIVVMSSYFLGRSYIAEYHFKKSIDAYGKKNNIKEIYDNQRLAIVTNPYIERFRISFSQTNLLIANNIAARSNTPEVNDVNKNTSGVENNLSTQDRQTMTQAIQAAIEEAKAAVKLNEQKATNWENLAIVYRNLINTAQDADTWTISSYQRAILLDPQNPKYRLDLGGVYFLLGKYDEANRFFEQTVTLKPDWPNAHYNLAWALYERKDYQRAVSEMQIVIKLLDAKKDATDLSKAQKELEEFKKKFDQQNGPP